MIRRFSAALIGLVLCLPIFAVPVAAHGSTQFAIASTVLADGTIVGTVTNHTSGRRSNIQVTAVYENGDTDISASVTALVTNVAPHNSTPFRLDPVPDVTGKNVNSLTATGSITGTKPTGGLHVDEGTFSTNVYSGNITNDGSATVNNVVVYAARLNGTSFTDAKPSATIPTLAAGASATYVITFDPASAGGEVSTLIAKGSGSTTGPTPVAGPYYTSWNNYFGDLDATLESFVDEIAWMADTGITTGCGAAIFCPKSSVTRAQMAVFLDRALNLPTGADQGFDDIGTQSLAFQEAINNLAAAGITGGCQDDEEGKFFCPNSPVTRGQMSKFIVTGYGDEGNKDIAAIPTPEGEDGNFTDDNGHFSEDYNNAMDAAGITSGCGGTKFCPNQNVLREQMAVFMNRADALPATP